jgi:hypothetical protein
VQSSRLCRIGIWDCMNYNEHTNGTSPCRKFPVAAESCPSPRMKTGMGDDGDDGGAVVGKDCPMWVSRWLDPFGVCRPSPRYKTRTRSNLSWSQRAMNSTVSQLESSPHHCNFWSYDGIFGHHRSSIVAIVHASRRFGMNDFRGLRHN